VVKRSVPGWQLGLVMLAFIAAVAWPSLARAQDAAHAPTAGEESHEHIGQAGGVNTDPAEVRTDMALYTLVVFLLLLGVLWKFAWGPIVAALETREKHIHAEIAEAERANAEAQRLLAEHGRKLAEVQNEVRVIIDEARRAAQHTQQEILKQAQDEAQATRVRALRDIEQAKDRALQDIFQTAADVATEAAAQIVRRTLNPQDHRDLVAQVIKDLPSRN
jgi:F-type H+-transporting ATPase subunit b